MGRTCAANAEAKRREMHTKGSHQEVCLLYTSVVIISVLCGYLRVFFLQFGNNLNFNFVNGLQFCKLLFQNVFPF